MYSWRALLLGVLVAALGLAGCTSSTQTTAGPEGEAPGAPCFVSLAELELCKVRVRWADSPISVDQFELQRRDTGGNPGYVTIAYPQGDANEYNDLGLAESTTYTYRLRASNQYGTSPWSEERSITTSSYTPPLEDLKLYPTEDAYVDDLEPDRNFGGDSYLMVSNDWISRTRRALLKFDYSLIPAGAEIVEAELSIMCQNEGEECGHVQLTRAAQPWSEYSVTWNNQPVTSGIIYWSELVQNDGMRDTWYMVTILERYLDGTHMNNGLVLKITSEAHRSAILYSSDRPLVYRPYLYVVYRDWGRTAQE